MQQNSYRKFIISNTKESLSAALNTISAYIIETLEGERDFNSIILRSKWVLTELLSNVSKHSNDHLTYFEIHKKNSVLEITRSDCGKPFLLSLNNERNSFTAPGTQNKKYIIQKDDLSILYANVSAKNVLIFEIEDVDVDNNNVLQISEHFGLVIMVRSSDEFSYKYDNCTKTNVFKAIFLL